MVAKYRRVWDTVQAAVDEDAQDQAREESKKLQQFYDDKWRKHNIQVWPCAAGVAGWGCRRWCCEWGGVMVALGLWCCCQQLREWCCVLLQPGRGLALLQVAAPTCRPF